MEPSPTDSGPVNPIILIPARLQSQRLPDKPLADIAGVPMIVHVMRRAEEADLGRVVVACAEPEIADAVTAAGGEAVLTRADHPSGSDRIHEALSRLDADGRHDAVINIQGDLPTLAPDMPRRALGLLADPAVDIGTLAAEIRDAGERDDPNVVKAVVSVEAGAEQGRALYFTRARAPSGDGILWHHIGLYAYRSALSRSPPALWSSANGSSNCAPSRPACGSMWPSLTLFPSVSILRAIWTGRAS